MYPTVEYPDTKTVSTDMKGNTDLLKSSDHIAQMLHKTCLLTTPFHVRKLALLPSSPVIAILT